METLLYSGFTLPRTQEGYCNVRSLSSGAAGAVYVESGVITVNGNSSFIGNTAQDNGGEYRGKKNDSRLSVDIRFVATHIMFWMCKAGDEAGHLIFASVESIAWRVHERLMVTTLVLDSVAI